MNKKYLGTNYGGWVVDLDSISDGDIIICGGVGEDISFEEELMKEKRVKIIEVDPTIKSHRFLENKLPKYSNIELIKKAIEKDDISEIKMFKNTNPEYVSESVSNKHSMVDKDSYMVECISIKRLIELYNPSFIKIDIEGSEYNVYEDCLGVKQICIEFHHHCISNKNIDDTMEIINFFKKNGYRLIDSTNNYHEVTLLKNNF